MITALLILIPLVASLIVFMLKGEAARKVALGAALIELAVCLYAVARFEHTDQIQYALKTNWIPSLGASFNIGMDGISLLMVLLASLLVPFIMLASFKHQYTKAGSFYGLMLLMQMALVGVFVALDGFLFYIFWELALIPIYFICLMWGGENRAAVTFKFFVYTLAGSLFMLVALVWVYLQTNVPGYGHSFSIDELYKAAQSMDSQSQGLIFWALFLAFAIKMPVFPFHTWQPDTYTTAPTPGTMLLSGIMLKMGTYGLIRWLIPMVPVGWATWGNTAMILAVIGIVYASCLAIVQKDFKRLIAYSSIAHVGLIAAGILAFNVQGLQGSIMQMLAHGVNVVALFYIVELIYSRMQTREIAQLGGIRNVAPGFAVIFLIVLLGSVALPLTNGFVGEFLLMNGVYQHSALMAAFAGLTIILGAVYMLRSYQGIMLGETNALTGTFTDLTTQEKWVLIPLVILIIAMGIYPKPLLDIAEPSVNKLITMVVSNKL